ncbi:MAG: Protein translocase subunit SecE [Candidatus Anoxychlamydiales bacterium]|nr:Protein translocase subunit SecE [Candidatus Anoxychlamydiales bacterium]NGX48880.1 Protein translocase subunit SecE [Candidatus Anoxychlamydiales bacterium]
MKKAKMTASSKIIHLKVKKKKLNYFREVQVELKKVSWTTKVELASCTKIVLGVTFFFSIAIYIADLVIKNALHVVSLIARILFG